MRADADYFQAAACRPATLAERKSPWSRFIQGVHLGRFAARLYRPFRPCQLSSSNGVELGFGEKWRKGVVGWLAYGLVMGRRKPILVPTRLAMRNKLPPCACRMERERESPMPSPSFLVLSMEVPSCEKISGSMPGP